jgi:peroxiredoxin
MKKLFSLVLCVLLIGASFGQRVENFTLTDVLSGQVFSLSDHAESKAVILVFTSLNCPFSKLYEERIVQMHADFGADRFVFTMIDPHLGLEEGENVEAAKARANEKKFIFPILDDKSQVVTRQFGITKLPEVVVITPSPTGWAIAYRGAIDNNPQVAANANMKYLENALSAIQNRRNPSPASTRPVGCNVKSR